MIIWGYSVPSVELLRTTGAVNYCLTNLGRFDNLSWRKLRRSRGAGAKRQGDGMNIWPGGRERNRGREKEGEGERERERERHIYIYICIYTHTHTHTHTHIHKHIHMDTETHT